MAKWQPRVSPEIEASLRALGPYVVTHGGQLHWDSAAGFDWPWGAANMGFFVHPRLATDADYRRLLDTWRRMCERQEEVREVICRAVLDSWDWVAENMPADEFAADPDAADEVVLGHIRGGHLSLGFNGSGEVSAVAQLDVPWEAERGILVQLIPPEEDDQPSWWTA